MAETNKRQDKILAFIEDEGVVAVADVLRYLNDYGENITKITVNRDLKYLFDLKLLETSGAGRAFRYKISPTITQRDNIDVEKYFSKDVDDREIKSSFNFDIFTEKEKNILSKLNDKYLKNG